MSSVPKIGILNFNFHADQAIKIITSFLQQYVVTRFHCQNLSDFSISLTISNAWHEIASEVIALKYVEIH